MWVRLAVAWLSIAAGTACDRTAPPAPSAPTRPSPIPDDTSSISIQVAFSSSRDRGVYIFVFTAPHGEVRRLTNGRAPDWSRTGRIAFEGWGGRVPPDGIWVIDADGTGERYVGDGANPSWSPDGRYIAAVRNDGVYVLAADGGEPDRRVARTPAGFDGVLRVAWSPDGGRIAFGVGTAVWSPWDAWQTETGPIHVVVADGSSPPIPLSAMKGDMPAWSPDGSQIAYYEDGVIFVAQASGVAIRAVAEGAVPSWAPDGRLVFQHQGRIMVAGRDGAVRQLIPDTPAGLPRYSDSDPSVSRSWWPARLP
jgi:Tol biopolymer transport system component